MIQKKQISNQQKKKIQTYFTNKDVQNLLIEQLSQLHNNQLMKNYIFSFISEHDHLFLYFNQIKEKDQQEGKDQPKKYGSYCIRITKAFPLSGLRVYLLNNIYEPKIFDSRDVCQEILGCKWTFRNHLIDIFKNVNKFQSRLALRNNNFLSMQKTGQFIVQDVFSQHELKKFLSLQLFKDVTKEQGNLLGTTQTHLLTFKQLIQKQKKALKKYMLLRVCQLQCISDIYLSQKQEIIIAVNKYKNIKSFNQYQKVSRKYILDDSHQFLYNIFKNVGKFQKVQISLQLKRDTCKQSQDYEKIRKLISQSQKLQKELTQQISEQYSKQVQQSLIKIYHTIIEYYSEKQTAYHILFVNKLNKIYTKRTEQK